MPSKQTNPNRISLPADLVSLVNLSSQVAICVSPEKDFIYLLSECAVTSVDMILGLRGLDYKNRIFLPKVVFSILGDSEENAKNLLVYVRQGKICIGTKKSQDT